jgi:hypothetical protein
LPSDSEEEEDDDADMPANPNHSKAARKQTRVPAPEVAAATQAVKKMSLKEPVDNKKLQAQAMNDKIKSDMERLARIRQEREDAARQKEVCLTLRLPRNTPYTLNH